MFFQYFHHLLLLLTAKTERDVKAESRNDTYPSRKIVGDGYEMTSEFDTSAIVWVLTSSLLVMMMVRCL